jgi:methanogenic corrinoid protein MtbC1
MRIEHRCAVELLRARVLLVGGLLQRSPAFGPSWPHWYGDDPVHQCSAEAEFHLLQLAAALRFSRREMFVQHVQWLRVVLTHRGLSDKAILLSLRALIDLAHETLAPELAAQVVDYVRASLLTYHAVPDRPAAPADSLQAECLQALLAEDPGDWQRWAASIIRAGMNRDACCLAVLSPVLHEVGRLWQVNAISVEQEHQCTARAAGLMDRLASRRAPRVDGRTAVCACTVGERHELGIRMVAGSLEDAGWTVICPDEQQDPSGLLRTIIDRRADLVAISATMLQHLHALETLVAAIRAMPECADVPVLVGGQAFERHPHVWREIGADATAADAREALSVANGLVPQATG